MKGTKIQWHSGFVAAIDLELAKNRKDLIYEREYNLNMKPLEIDLLVIKKEPDVRISNEIGRLFRRHNIMEYKSPEDHLGPDDFYKTGAYAALYKAYGKTSDERKVEDITVSILREAKPETLFHWLREHGFTILNPYHGIYYIVTAPDVPSGELAGFEAYGESFRSNGVLFPTQIIVTRELDRENHTWLKALSNKMQKQDMENLMETINTLPNRYDRELADSVLEVTSRANAETIDELMKGDAAMTDALLEIFAPFIEREAEKRAKVIAEEKVKAIAEEKATKKTKERIRETEIKSGIEFLREYGHDDNDIKEFVMKKFHLTEEEVKAFL